VQEQDPELRQATVDLESSSKEVLRRTSDLEAGSWKRVQEDHRRAHHLINQAEWALSICFLLHLSVQRMDQFHPASSGCETIVELKTGG
jgi:hypothetical protein